MRTFWASSIAAALAAAFIPALAAAAPAVSEISINGELAVSVKNFKVTQKASSAIYGRVSWGTAFIRLTIVTNGETLIKKSRGERATLAEIAEGDVLNVEGTLRGMSDTIGVDAALITDLSLERQREEFKGTVQVVDYAGDTFALVPDGSIDPITVAVGTSTQIRKGIRFIGIGSLNAGDKILSASGIFNYRTNTLEAQTVVVFQDMTIFQPRNFQGVLRSVSALASTTALVISVDGADYTVYLAPGAAILNTARRPAALSRFVAGDAVRFYGARRQDDLNAFDADTLRNLNF